MPIIFATVAQIKQKLHFWIALIKTFSMMYILFGSAEVLIFQLFSIVFGNDIIMMSFLVTRICRLSLASFICKLRKTQWWCHHYIISCCWNLKISNFAKLDIGYHPSKFQICCLSGSNFLEVSVKADFLSWQKPLAS